MSAKPKGSVLMRFAACFDQLRATCQSYLDKRELHPNVSIHMQSKKSDASQTRCHMESVILFRPITPIYPTTLVCTGTTPQLIPSSGQLYLTNDHYTNTTTPRRPSRDQTFYHPIPSDMERTLLSSLPEELISNIACKLGSDDIFAFRLTCKAIETKSLHEFATEYFSEKCVHLTTDSLKALVDISGSKLNKYVKGLSLVTALFDKQGFQCPGRATTHWRPSVRQSEAYKFYISDQGKLLKTGRSTEMLALALCSLPSLKVISYMDTPASLNPNADYRGGNKVFRQTGTRPINGHDSLARVRSKEFQTHLTNLWYTLITALTDASGSGLKLEEFHTSFCTDASFLTPKLFSLKPPMLAKLSVVFDSVTRLHLHLKTPEDNRRIKEMFARFTATLPNLKELTLDFDTKQPDSGLLFRRFTAGIDHSKLTSLNLTGLSIDAALLTRSIVKLTHVKDLRLYCVEVNSGSWPTVLAGILKLKHIDHLHMMYLRESGCKSYFLKQPDPADIDHPDVLDPAFFADEWDVEEDDNDDDDTDDDSDGGMPDLQPVNESLVAQTTASDPVVTPSTDPAAAAPAAPAATSPATAPAAAPPAAAADPVDTAETQVDDDVMSEYVPDGIFDGIERGFFICIEGHEKIAKRLVTFMDEYNLGEFMDPAGDFMGMGAVGVAAMGAGGGMAIPVAAGAGIPPPGALVGQSAGGFGAFMNAMGLASLGPLPGAAPHGNHHPPPFAIDAAPAASTAPAPATSNGNTTGSGAATTAATAPTMPPTASTSDDGGLGSAANATASAVPMPATASTWHDDAAWVDEDDGGAHVDNVD